MIQFKIQKSDKSSRARVGEIHTPHGIVKTPAFTPVGTQATVKSVSPFELSEIGAEIIFGNTYHLHLRPGEDVIKDFGGLAKFMSWNGPTFTDSGGFQVFSLGQKKIIVFDPGNHAGSKVVDEKDDADEETKLVKINQDGVKFRSHLDGSQHLFTPEISIQIQKKLGADLILAVDECVPYPSTKEYAKEATDRTHEWAKRSLREFKNKESTFFEQGLYGIIQGGVFEDLRVQSAKFISSLDFFGIAIGGVSVGESKKEMRDVLTWVTPHLPEEKPRHLLGIGEIDDIFAAVEFGMDTFDCVIPTRFGRYGIVFCYPPEGNPKNKFRLDVNRTAYAKDKGSVVTGCECFVCKNYSRGYVHHLLKANELLAYRLASYHNVYFLVNLTKQIRQAILEDRFENLKEKWLS